MTLIQTLEAVLSSHRQAGDICSCGERFAAKFSEQRLSYQWERHLAKEIGKISFNFDMNWMLNLGEHFQDGAVIE